MKTFNFLILFTAIITALSSCSSDKKTQSISSTVAETQSETRGIKATKGFGKFSVDNIYLDLKFDYTFEASFEDGVVINGKWAKEDDGKTLKLSSDKSGDGKGKSFLKEFTIIEFNDAVIKLEDKKSGKQLELSAEE